MISGQLLEALIEAWDELPSAVTLDAWYGLYRQIEPLFDRLRLAASAEERAERLQEVMLVFKGHPAAQRRLRRIFGQIQSMRSVEGEEPLPEWPAQIAAFDRLLHPGMTTRYTHVVAPRRAPRGSWQSITVRLTAGPESPASVPLPVEEAGSVEVSLQAAADGVEIAQPATGMLWITAGEETPPVAFLFRGREVGMATMLLDFRRQGRPVGQVPVCVEIVLAAIPEAAPRQLNGPVFCERPIPQPVDLELEVDLVFRQGRRFLTYRLNSPSQALDFHHQKVEGPEIGAPEAFRAGLLAKIEKLQTGLDVNDSPLLVADVARKLEGIGHNLHDALFSSEMRQAYRQIRERARTLLVTSREPYIPWELIKPYDDETPGEPLDDDFLGCKFQMTRWLAGRWLPAAAIRVAGLACVEAGTAPGAKALCHAAEERKRLAELASAHRIADVSPSPATFAAIESLLEEGRAGIFHAVAHGDFDAQHPDESSLLLVDGQSFRAEDLHGRIQTGIHRARPMVFLNACRVGQQGWALAGLGGWARRWVERCGCGAFVAPLWSVKDRLACEFAKTFYETAGRGETLGAAVQAARLRVRAMAPAQPTWLAYSAYAHPNGRLVFGGGEESRRL